MFSHGNTNSPTIIDVVLLWTLFSSPHICNVFLVAKQTSGRASRVSNEMVSLVGQFFLFSNEVTIEHK